LADDIGGTALSYALCSGHDDLLKLLFKRGTKVDLEDDTIMALLFPAVKKGYEAVVELLLETGKVNPDIKDVYGWTPLSYAVEGGSVAIVQHLLAKGVEMDYKYNIDRRRIIEIEGEIIIERIIEIEGRRIRTPLSRAAEKGNERVVKLLLENGARPDFEDEDGHTPLSRAVDEKVVKLLKSHRTSNA